MQKDKQFILAGNGPYTNRGCEAIIRGSVKILQKHFENSNYVVATVFPDELELQKQRVEEFDRDILHAKINISKSKYDYYWFLDKMRKYYNRIGESSVFKPLDVYINNSDAVLSVGGDNYSLDYGIPRLFTLLDSYVKSRKKPIVIWGASVGPFNAIPEYEKYMLKHLKTLDGIFIRESSSYEYLNENGITSNLYKVTDPAFLMEPDKPRHMKVNDDISESIGLNFSPLFSSYVCQGDRAEWVKLAAEIVKGVLDEFKRPVYLIPHVGSKDNDWDDYKFIQDVYESCTADKTMLNLVPGNLNAAQVKWVISQLYVFAGARTHSTIAAFSTAVPVLSFSYSLKSIGINKDIYGNCDYCLDPKDIKVSKVIEKIGLLIDNHSYLKNKINNKLPDIKEKAYIAGKYLKDIITNF